jgi:GT2 family glycosyltransferase
MSDVAIVILNYNGRNYLEKFLPSVAQNSDGCEVIIADNCSTDDSISFLNTAYPDLRIIEIPSNLGFSAGYNFALERVQAEYYVLLNSDVEVTPNWTSPIISMMAKDQNIAAAQPKILSYDQKEYFEYAGAGGGQLDYLGYPFCRGRIFDELEKDNGQYDDVSQTFWATGACLFIRSEVYHQLGGLDDDFFAHMEEIDLCWRINSAGYTVMYNGESTVYHVGGGTLPKSNPRKTYLNFRNGLTLLVKNYSMGQLFTRLPIRILLDLVAAVKFTFSGSVKDGWAVIKAVIYFSTHISTILRKRIKVTKHKSKDVDYILYQQSIVYRYFLKGIRKYQDL